MEKQFISWRRVSTFKQNRTGLGLAAQKEIIKYFIEKDGGEWVADYEECYTGKELSGCVELHKAMEHAKKTGATLIIAKSDRFRNTAEALKIYEQMGDGHIMFCDLPATDKFTLTLFFALAEREALLVSIRTKQALAVRKAQGCNFGARNETYKKNYDMKTEEQKKKIGIKRGQTRNRRKMENRDTQTLIKVLRREFVLEDDINEWKWWEISLRDGMAVKLLQSMKDFKDMDDSGRTFAKWDFSDLHSNKLYHKLANTIMSLKKSVYYANGKL